MIAASSGTSFVHETEGQVILNGSYDIGFTLDLALKDLGLALALGRETGVPLALAELTEETFAQARDAYGGEAWSPLVVKLLEDALGEELRAPGFPASLPGAPAGTPRDGTACPTSDVRSRRSPGLRRQGWTRAPGSRRAAS